MTCACERPEVPQPNIKLYPRELQVLGLAAEGLTNAEIGEQLFIGVNTVKTYMGRVHAKLEVTSRVAMVVKAIRLGLIEI